jgi:hypothetical protein
VVDEGSHYYQPPRKKLQHKKVCTIVPYIVAVLGDGKSNDHVVGHFGSYAEGLSRICWQCDVKHHNLSKPYEWQITTGLKHYVSPELLPLLVSKNIPDILLVTLRVMPCMHNLNTFPYTLPFSSSCSLFQFLKLNKIANGDGFMPDYPI